MFIERLSEKDIKFLVKYTINADKHEIFSYNFSEIEVKKNKKTKSNYAYVIVDVENRINEKNRFFIYLSDDIFKVSKFVYEKEKVDSDYTLKSELKYNDEMYQMVYNKGMVKLFGNEYEQYLLNKCISKNM